MMLPERQSTPMQPNAKGQALRQTNAMRSQWLTPGPVLQPKLGSAQRVVRSILKPTKSSQAKSGQANVTGRKPKKNLLWIGKPGSQRDFIVAANSCEATVIQANWDPSAEDSVVEQTRWERLMDSIRMGDIDAMFAHPPTDTSSG